MRNLQHESRQFGLHRLVRILVSFLFNTTYIPYKSLCVARYNRRHSPDARAGQTLSIALPDITSHAPTVASSCSYLTYCKAAQAALNRVMKTPAQTLSTPSLPGSWHGSHGFEGALLTVTQYPAGSQGDSLLSYGLRMRNPRPSPSGEKPGNSARGGT